MIKPYPIILCLLLLIALSCSHEGPPESVIHDCFIQISEEIKLYYQLHGNGQDTIVVVHGGPGDCAGPAFLKIEDTYYLAGVGSAQNTQVTEGIEGLYGVTEYYVRVSTFIDWIEKTISEE